MKKLATITTILLFSLLLFAKSEARQTQVDMNHQQLLAQAEEKGEILLIITLDVPFQPLGDDAVMMKGIQREVISQQAETVLSRNTDQRMEFVQTFNNVPYVALKTDYEGLQALINDPGVRSIHENVADKPFMDISNQIIGSPEVWDLGFTGEGTVVAVLDTGVDKDHPHFTDRVVAEACFSTPFDDGFTTSTCPDPDASFQQFGEGAADDCDMDIDGCGHGTHVAGTVAGSSINEDQSGVFEIDGVAKDAEIIAVQVFTIFDHTHESAPCGEGADKDCVLSYVSDQIAALDWLYDERNNYNLVAANMSLGGGESEEACDDDLRKSAMDNLKEANIATIVASGNDGFKDAISFPACISTAISVGSTQTGKYLNTTQDVISDFSNSADILDLLAPGHFIESVRPDNEYAGLPGTSMAAPHVAGAWALYRQAFPDTSVDDLLEALKDHGVHLTDSNNITTSRIQIDATFGQSYAGGEGTENSPYQIANEAHLLAIALDPDAAYELINDISLTQFTNNVVFTGQLDGNGHALDFSVSEAGDDFYGLFRELGAGSVIRNLRLTGQISLTDALHSGALAPEMSGGLIEQVHSQVTLSVAGTRFDSIIGSVTGGLVGSKNGGTIRQSSNSGLVRGYLSVGGLVSRNWGGSIEQSFNSGTVWATGSNGAGGIAESNRAIVENVYSTGRVTGSNSGNLVETSCSNCGGLVGVMTSGSLLNSYSTGFVNSSSDLAGAIVGQLANDTVDQVENLFFDAETSGQTEGAGGSGGSALDGTGRTTAQMKTLSTFTGAGWDFEGETANGIDNIWTNKDPSTGFISYPFLSVLDYDTPETDPEVKPIPGLTFIYAGGSGTSEDPYEIETWEHLHNIRFNLGADFELKNNLDENTEGYATYVKDDETLANGGQGWEPIGSEAEKFTGQLDGAGFTISDLHINWPTEERVGLFSWIDSDGSQVKNFRLENVSVTGGSRVGALAGELSDHASIELLSSSGTVEGTDFVGGIIGIVEGRGSVYFSFSNAEVKGNNRVGGLIGYLFGTLANSYVQGGEVQATGLRNGGLVGDVFKGDILNTYSANKVINASAILGHNHEDEPFTFSNNFWDIDVTNQNTSILGEGLSSLGLKKKATFISAGWDFTEDTGVWSIEQGNRISYPYLQSIDYDEPGTDPAVNPIPGLEDLFTLELSGDAGWRMLSLPVGNVEVSTLAGQNLVQGIPGGNDFYNDDVNYEDAAPNLIHYSDNEGWQNFTNFDSGITSGQGFIWYLFNNTEANSVELPFSLSVSGSSPSSDVVIPMNSNDDFTLIGNPFSGDLDASNVSGWGDLQATARTWNPAAGDNGEYEITTSEESPFTGFFVEKSESGSGDITIPVAVRKQSESERFMISLNLQGVNANGVVVSDHSTSVVFREGAEHGWDIYDATKLVPLLSSYASIGIVGERAGEARIKAIDSRPIDIEQAIHLPLGLRVENFGGEFDLSAEMQNLPESWLVFLHDKQTGQTVDLASGSHHFSYQPVSQAKAVSEIEHNIPERFKQSAEQAIDRFTLTIDPSESALDPGLVGDLPDRISLSQNYPNPFNPATQIRYELPQAGQVSLEVFDMAGRRVAELVNGQVNAGVHTVSFDGSGLSSGVYMYRLQVAGQVFTRKLTLIK